MYFSNSVLVLAALSAGVSARPSHRHAQFHDGKRAVGDMVTAVIDGVAVEWVNEYAGGATATADAASATTAASTAVTTTAAAEASTTAEASSTASSSTASSSAASNSDEVTEYTSFCSSSSKRATTEEIAYAGSGTSSSDYGCNQLLISSDLVDSYDYTATFTLDDSNSDDWSCVCWNKIGPDGGINGWFGHAAVSFSLSPGTSQNVAFEENSQGGCTCGSGSVPMSSSGEYAGTWVEFDMANTSNDDWSGADASALVAQAADMSVQGLKVSHSSCDSTILAGGSATNAYISGMEDVDGTGCNISPGNVNLAVTVGYSG